MGYSIADAKAAAGVDPWELAAQLPQNNGVPDAYASGYGSAAGHARDATDAARNADSLTADSFRNDGTGVHPAQEATESTRRALGDGGERFEDMSQMLRRVSQQLASSRSQVAGTIWTLDEEIDRIGRELQMAGAAPYLGRGDAASQERLLFEQAVTAIRQGGSAIHAQVDAYDTALRAGLPMVATRAVPPPWRPSAVSFAGATPAQVAATWTSLDPVSQAQLIRTRPNLLGSLDGLPGAVRDAANRERLPAERLRLEGMGNTEGVAAIDVIARTLAQGDRQLLALDTTGKHITAAVGIGNIDTARNVAVFTPGMLTTVQGGLDGYDRSMGRLRVEAMAQARVPGGDPSTAVVSWLGYEAPQDGWELVDPARSVGASVAAIAGAEQLSGFLSGITASRPDDPHLTALGHSYGSLVTGVAVQKDTGVDDVVFFGSPGVGSAESQQVGVPAGNAYVVESDGDPVADAGWFGADPNQDDRLVNLSTSAAIAPDTTLPLRQSITHDTVRGDGAGYLDDGTTSQHNIAAVVAGAGAGDMVIGRNEDWTDRARQVYGAVPW